MPYQLIELNKALAFAYPASPYAGVIKLSPEDFFVEEELGFTPSGQGNHLFLFIEKHSTNTHYLAEQLAKQFNLAIKDIGYSGLKDRQAVTRQWFSLPWPVAQELPDIAVINTDNWQVLQQARHNKKLKRGSHKANIFKLRLHLANPDEQAAAWLEERWQLITTQGVPNYFGSQRFGRNYQNILGAMNWLVEKTSAAPKRQAKSLYLSALRSALFNIYTSEQVIAGRWLNPAAGSRFNLNASNSFFTDSKAENLAERLQVGDIHPAAPLAGRGQALAEGDALAIEAEFIERFAVPWQALAQQGLKLEYKAQRLVPQSLGIHWESPYLHLAFKLPTGCFATSVVRELIVLE